MDPKICTFCSKQDIIKILLFASIGMLPYLKIERETFMAPYMTEDFTKMKIKERSNARTKG